MSKTDPTIPSTNETTATATGTNVVALPGSKADERPSDKVMAFVKQHPVITIAGGIALGVAVSALLPRGTRRKLLSRASDLAEVAGTAGAVLGKRGSEKMHDASIHARKRASLFAHKAEKAGDATAIKLEKYGAAAAAAATAFGRSTARRASRLSDAAVDTASHLSDVAATRSTEMLHRAHDLKSRAKSKL